MSSLFSCVPSSELQYFFLGFEVDLDSNSLILVSDLDLTVQSRIAVAGLVRLSETILKSSSLAIVAHSGC